MPYDRFVPRALTLSLLLAVAAALALSIAGCGGDSTTTVVSTSEKTTAPAETTTATEPPATIEGDLRLGITNAAADVTTSMQDATSVISSCDTVECISDALEPTRGPIDSLHAALIAAEGQVAEPCASSLTAEIASVEALQASLDELALADSANGLEVVKRFQTSAKLFSRSSKQFGSVCY